MLQGTSATLYAPLRAKIPASLLWAVLSASAWNRRQYGNFQHPSMQLLLQMGCRWNRPRKLVVIARQSREAQHGFQPTRTTNIFRDP